LSYMQPFASCGSFSLGNCWVAKLSERTRQNLRVDVPFFTTLNSQHNTIERHPTFYGDSGSYAELDKG
jgi:hypothetical protein